MQKINQIALNFFIYNVFKKRTDNLLTERGDF